MNIGYLNLYINNFINILIKFIKLIGVFKANDIVFVEQSLNMFLI